jgi:hypothetical protein
MKKTFIFLLVFLLTAQAFLNSGTHSPVIVQAQTAPDVFVGVDIAYGGVNETKAVIDQVSPYTNLIVLGNKKATDYVNTCNETIQYAYDHGLYVVTFQPSMIPYLETGGIQEWFSYAYTTWGDHFLGIYSYDEPGGKQLESNFYHIIATDYVDAASKYENALEPRSYLAHSLNYSVFTSDFGLYWFDYKVGYDAVFAEFVWNYDRQLTVALTRGAATVQNKDWGIIIDWKYSESPYIESGDALYSDMVLAYENGAKYIVIFDTNKDYTQGILGNEQLEAMQRFWEYTQTHPRNPTPTIDRTGYILPDGYGYGFRGPQDTIWGLWGPDSLTNNICLSANALLNQYGSNLDIIYDDGLQLGNNGYGQLIRWNSYVPPTSTPSPTAPPLPTPTPSPAPVLTASQTLTPTPSPSPSPSPTQQSTPEPTTTPTDNNLSLQAKAYWIGPCILAVTLVAVASIFLLRKSRNKK